MAHCMPNFEKQLLSLVNDTSRGLKSALSLLETDRTNFRWDRSVGLISQAEYAETMRELDELEAICRQEAERIATRPCSAGGRPPDQ